MTKWLSTDEAATYLGIGKTKLYTLTRAGRIPATRLGKKWTYEQEVLAEWLRRGHTIDDFFLDTPAEIEGNASLRDPQRDAHRRALEFFDNGGQKAIIQMPVGCGKSGLVAILPFGMAKGRVLVIAPNLTIKDELYKSLDITNKQKCFWRRMQVLADRDMVNGPYVATLDTGNLSVCEKSHIILTNIQQLGVNADKWLNRFPDDFFDLIVVDEAHHGAAASWKRVFQKFPAAKVVNLTATPFRSDRQELEGDLIFRYPFKSASIKGYIKRLKASYVAPSELTFTVEGNERTYTLEQVLAMKEEEWFSRGVALSDPCNVSIVDNSLEKLEHLRQSGTKHQLIGVACSINHAQRIRSLYKERGYDAAIIHSKQKPEEQETVLRELRSGVLDCIIQVQMLGEGFDHPKLSVAAIFRPFRSLAPYIQFVGRILRVVVQNDPNHPDNYGQIVTHVGMNLDELLKKFKQFENDDQKFWEEVTGGQEPEPPHAVTDGDARMKLHEDMVVNHEIVDSLFEEDFTTAEDTDIVEDLEKKLESLGLDPALARQVLERSRRGTGPSVSAAASPFPIIPAKQWQEARKRLDEEAKRTAKLVLNRTGLTPHGVELPYKLKPGLGARNNFVGAFQMVNEAITKRMGKKKRREWTTEEFAAAINSLQDILNGLVREVKKLQNVKG
ncbi:MAG: DEAD/DEAH box helicase family protein [Myxococcales bacterium]|nr:DEAD/DEAH box helicase family protein [Myxococcales bacterium]MCB9576672.1 DEAD/DEAH box helicase family protein [Polyangiaceae bacterium]